MKNENVLTLENKWKVRPPSIHNTGKKTKNNNNKKTLPWHTLSNAGNMDSRQKQEVPVAAVSNSQQGIKVNKSKNRGGVVGIIVPN